MVAGDGTTSVTVICGALLKKCLDLLERGVHPTVISDAFNKAADRAVEVLPHCIRHLCFTALLARLPAMTAGVSCVQVLEGIAVPVDLSDREALVKAANTLSL